MSDGKVEVDLKINDKNAKKQADAAGKDIGKSVQSGAKQGEKALDGLDSKFTSTFNQAGKTASNSLKGVSGDFNNVENSAEEAGNSASDAFGSKIPIAAAAAAAAIAVCIAKVIEFTKESVEVGKEFDKAMSQVAATMGVTKDDIQELDAFAQHMGATTAFSATESAQALNYMALAGYDAETSMQMLPTVLNLAAAGNFDLARASDMVTDAQSALGLSIEETTVMVDQMAKTSSTTNTSVEQLGDAFLTVGGTAKNLKGGTAELAEVLGLLADNGIKGSEGGTALRNMILSLTAPTDAAAETIEDLGLAVFDAEGNMRSMPDIMADLNEALDSLTQEERINAISNIFNKRDLKSVEALLGTTAERYDEVAASIDGAAGSAKKMSETQLDNLAGDLTLLQSATEGFQISIERFLDPALRSVAQTAGEAFGGMKEAWDNSMSEGNFTGAGAAIARGLTDIINTAIEQIPQFVKAGTELMGGFAVGFVSALPGLISTIITALVESIPALIEGAINVVTALVNALPTIVTFLVNAIPTVITSIVNALVSSIDILIDGFIQLFLAVVDALPDIITALVDAVPTIVDAIVEGLITSIDALIQGFIALFLAIVQNLPTIIRSLVDAAPTIIAAIVGGLLQSIGVLIQGFVQLFLAFIMAMPQIILAIVEALPQIIEAIVTTLVSAVPLLLGTAVKLFTGFLNGITTMVPQIIQNVIGFVTGIIDEIKKAPDRVLEIGMDIVEGLWNGISSMVDWVIGKITGFCSDALGAIKNFFGIESPSKVMRDVVGKNMARGMVIGFKEEDPMSQIRDSIEDGFSDFELTAKGISVDAGEITGSGFLAGFNASNPMEQIADTVRASFDSLSVMMQAATTTNTTTNNQVVNFNQPISSPDEVARAMRMQQHYGLAGSY